MSRPWCRPTPAFDRLTADERAELLGELLALHPELMADAERLALARMAAVDPDDVAEAIEWALREADTDQLAYRVGRVRGRGYLHENEAASEILEELLQQETRRPHPVVADSAQVGLPELGRNLGLGAKVGRGSAVIKALGHLEAFNLGRWLPDNHYALGRAVAPLTNRQAQRLPQLARAIHYWTLRPGRYPDSGEAALSGRGPVR